MESKSLETSLLRSFSPLDGLKLDNLHALARKAVLRDLSAGRVLFKEGDADKRTYYLVSGTLELMQDNRVVATIRGGTPEARNPLTPTIPRRYSARVASERIEFITLDSDLLDVMLTWDQTGSYEVSELRGGSDDMPSSDDWMTTLLQTKAFHKIPAANIQAIFMRMQRVDFKAGEVVIKQGDEGDYFYVIVKGKCTVTRETPLNKEGIKLAELGMGDTFGEEALISDAKRNASVTMSMEGTLMRLGKDDFRTLLNEPLLEWTDYEEAALLVSNGAKWLDVRLPSEFENYHLPDALNIPLYFMRLKMKNLDKEAHYIVCCDSGRRSSAGAYILNERGFQASVLKGGLATTDLARK